jgi:hypothetical protein
MMTMTKLVDLGLELVLVLGALAVGALLGLRIHGDTNPRPRRHLSRIIRRLLDGRGTIAS